MNLSDAAIRRAKTPSKPTKLSDGLGLYLYMTPAGGKLWRFKYRFHGKEKVMSFGGCPDVPLAEARNFRDAARRLVARQLDPMAVRKEQEAAARFAMSNSFAAVARQWWHHWKADRTEKHTQSVLNGARFSGRTS
jgi:hypothetical protein